MATQTLSKDEILDAIGNMSVFELAELIEAFKSKFGVTIAAYKKPGAEWTNADAETVLGQDDTILIVGPTRKAEGFAQLQ